jgi:hypothetical protein
MPITVFTKSQGKQTENVKEEKKIVKNKVAL